jgi:hypothetical protein
MRDGKARVPDVAILSTARRLQRPRPRRGSHRLYRASPGEDGAFQITEIAG